MGASLFMSWLLPRTERCMRGPWCPGFDQGTRDVIGLRIAGAYRVTTPDHKC